MEIVIKLSIGIQKTIKVNKELGFLQFLHFVFMGAHKKLEKKPIENTYR